MWFEYIAYVSKHSVMYIQLSQNAEGWSLFWVITENDMGVFSFKFICNKFKSVDWECDV